MNRLGSIILVFICFFTYGIANDSPIKVLVLSGQNNHDWKRTTPAIVDILLCSGEFVVTVVHHPEHILSVDLDGIDVILSDWNTYGGKKGENVSTWSDKLKDTYVSFVQKGGGHVVVHAGSSSFPDWTDYQQICLATWKSGQTGHGKQHEFEVTATHSGESHVIVDDVVEFSIHDELWHRAAVSENAIPLLSAFSSKEFGGTGRLEPVVFVGEFGQGRCFTTLLGHQANAEDLSMNDPHFGRLLIRGTRWAAKR